MCFFPRSGFEMNCKIWGSRTSTAKDADLLGSGGACVCFKGSQRVQRQSQAVEEERTA